MSFRRLLEEKKATEQTSLPRSWVWLYRDGTMAAVTSQFLPGNYSGIKNELAGPPLQPSTQSRPLISMTPDQSVNTHDIRAS